MKIAVKALLFLLLPIVILAKSIYPGVGYSNDFQTLNPQVSTVMRPGRLNGLASYSQHTVQGPLYLEGLTHYYYHPEYPRIDSMSTDRYTYQNEHIYVIDEKVYYTYDTTGEYVVHSDKYSFYYASVPLYYTDYYYDNQHRLIKGIYYVLNDNSNGYYETSRMYLIYAANAISSRVQKTQGYYYKEVYGHDAAGRIITSDFYASPDSIDWSENPSNTAYSYLPGDTSTGLDMIYYISHYTALDPMFAPIYKPGKLQEITTSIYSGTDMYRTVYSYNADTQLTEELSQYLEDGWQNQMHLLYYYNDNGNLDYYIDEQWWETQWSPPNHKQDYLYDNETANDDNSQIPANINLKVYPNPFTSSVNIALTCKSNAPVKAEVYNIKGQLIKALSGSKTLTWDGTDTSNQTVSNGIYFIKAEQDGRAVTSKVIRIK